MRFWKSRAERAAEVAAQEAARAEQNEKIRVAIEKEYKESFSRQLAHVREFVRMASEAGKRFVLIPCAREFDWNAVVIATVMAAEEFGAESITPIPPTIYQNARRSIIVTLASSKPAMPASKAA